MSLAFGFALPHWQPLSGGFSPASLFQGGTAGAWYDPSDLSTLFTTSAGTTPVAMPGQGAPVPVGLMLDKSQGLVLGPELVTPAANRDFSSNTGYWTIAGNITITGGQAVYTSANSLNGIYRTGFTTAGTYYEVTFTVGSITAGALRVYAGGNRTANVTTAGTYTQRVVAGSTDTLLIFECFGTTTLTLDDVSVKVVSGNHAISFNNTTARPELRARVNLLTYSEEFDNGAWARGNASVTQNAAVAPDGLTTADKLIANTIDATHTITQVISSIFLIPHTFSIYAKAAEYSFLSFGQGSPGSRTFFDLSSGVVVGPSTGAGLSNPTITPVGNGWYRCAGTIASLPSGSSFAVVVSNSSASETFTGNGTSGIYIWGADLRPANIGANVPAYQRIADANTYDTSGFPLYLLFEGAVGQRGMYTPANLNLSGTDKVAVFAGVRKLSDAATGVLVELGTAAFSTVGGFGIYASDGAAPNYSSVLRGNSNSRANVATTYSAPVSNVVTLQFDLAQALTVDGQKTRVNGLTPTLTPSQASADYGGGTNANASLYIGARNNSSLWLNGHLHSLIIAGSAVSAGNISATEQWVAGKTGIQI